MEKEKAFKNCPYCGEHLPFGSIFCLNCGKKVEESQQIPSKLEQIPLNGYPPTKNLVSSNINMSEKSDAVKKGRHQGGLIGGLCGSIMGIILIGLLIYSASDDNLGMFIIIVWFIPIAFILCPILGRIGGGAWAKETHITEKPKETEKF
ncbi:MAG: zinc ribbon domain-containing protein [Promethearchaeota archaeon]|jgi:hypothetical protein